MHEVWGERRQWGTRVCQLMGTLFHLLATITLPPPLHPSLPPAVGRTKEAGVLMVIAAGNQGADLHKTPYYPQSYATTYDTVLVVGATDEYDEHAFFSNYDPKTVHLSAPGHW